MCSITLIDLEAARKNRERIKAEQEAPRFWWEDIDEELEREGQKPAEQQPVQNSGLARTFLELRRRNKVTNN